MTRSASTDVLWRGDGKSPAKLRYLLRRQPRMQDFYDAFRADEARERGRIWYANISRQFGKSYSCCVIALEECLRRPGAQVKYASVDQKQARAIVFPQMEKILSDCPEDLAPTWRSQDGVYWFRNGSRLTIAGVDKDNVKKLRGPSMHLGIVDEGGFMGNLEEVVKGVFLPQTTTTGGRIIVATTPPDSAGHYASELYETCKSRDASAVFTLWENRLLGDAERSEIVRDMGGEESTQFRREYMCEFCTDDRNAVVPEFTQEAESEIVLDTPRPEYFNALVSLDGGFVDPAAALFAYVDFARARVVIEDEWLQKQAITADIARAIGAKEEELWGKTTLVLSQRDKDRRGIPSRLKRVLDHDPAMSEEFQRNHGMQWGNAQKRDLWANVNLLSQHIRQRTLEINPRCKSLIRQMHNVTWNGNKRTDGTTPRKTFARNSTDGHFDLVAALLYLLPEVDLFANPFPPTARAFNEWHGPLAEDERDDYGDSSLLNAFPGPRLD